MSDYRREQLLTYVGGPFLVLVGLALFVPSLLLLGLSQFATINIIGLVGGGAHCVYGAYVIREGRCRLASDHWRAEHFIP